MLGQLGATLGPLSWTSEDLPPIYFRSWALLGHYWSLLGALPGRSWAPSEHIWSLLWAPLGAILGGLRALLRRQKAIGSDKGRKPKPLALNIMCLHHVICLQDVGFLGASEERFFVHTGPSLKSVRLAWTVLGIFGAILAQP